jgi:hypothetical protein
MMRGSFKLEMAAAALAVGMAAAACGAETSEETVGSVGVALVAPGADGATYRLTPGAWLTAYGPTFFGTYSLDGDDATARIVLPVGSYEMWLEHGEGYSTAWPLERRHSDGTTQVVTAQLLTPLPIAATVLEGSLTNVVLRFEVPGVGPVTFADGDVDVSLEVDETVATGSQAVWSALLDVTSVHPGGASPALLATLPADGDTGLPLAIAVHQAGDWYPASPYEACVSVTVDAYSADAKLEAILLEATSGGSTRMCVLDDGTGLGSGVYFRASRFGAALSPPFQDEGTHDYVFIALLQAHLPVHVYDGTTLDLGALVGTHEVDAFASTRVFANIGGTFENWHVAFYGGTVTFEFVPTP